MNERIRELAEQAGVYEGVFTKHGGVPCDLKGYSMLPDEMAKFAELIVQECFDVVINDGRFHDAKGIIQAGKGVAMEHFGVER